MNPFPTITSSDPKALMDAINQIARIRLSDIAAASNQQRISTANIPGNVQLAAGDLSNGTTGTSKIVLENTPTINQPNIVGSTTNDAAAAGSVGEYVSSPVALVSAVALTNGIAATVTSIPLTAGDWDVDIQGYFTGGATTVFFYGLVSISSVTNTLDTTIGKYSYIFGQASGTPFASLTTQVSNNIVPYRISLASPSTIYFVAQSAFTTSTCSAYGIVRARRIR